MQVKSYFNADEMFADLDKLRMDAIKAFANCTEKQKALKEGDVFITIAEGLIIFNQIQTLDPEDEKEFEYAKEAGYVMVKAWSNACPEGEMGSVHRSRPLFKIIDNEKRTKDNTLQCFLDIWSTGGEITDYDIQWLNSDGNLEVLV
jgi:hypothetical protein